MNIEVKTILQQTLFVNHLQGLRADVCSWAEWVEGVGDRLEAAGSCRGQPGAGPGQMKEAEDKTSLLLHLGNCFD